jgi:hypothetical protein
MTHAELENPADLFANVAAQILAADTPAFPFAIYEPRTLQNTPMAINRVEITATGFARASDHMDWANISGTATPFWNHHRGSLSYAIISSRNDQNVTDNHAYCVGRIGYLCDRVTQKFTPTLCSGLQILLLEDAGQQTQVVEDEKAGAQDRTIRTFNLEYAIPASVYAAAT